MRTFIAATSCLSEINQWSELLKSPDFRKATRNMVMAIATLKPLVEKIKNLNNAALVLGSSHGELETSKDFLFTFAREGLARPFLFQNSLHNATTGFITLYFKMHGPSMTLSQNHFTGETVLKTAQDLLRSKKSQVVLAVGIDSQFEGMADGFREVYQKGFELSEGVGALLLTTEEGLRTLELKPLGVLEKVEMFREAPAGKTGTTEKYYESDAIERLCKAIAEPGAVQNVKLIKPDGSYSVIRWSR